MNELGKAGKAFAFLIDFDFQEPRLFRFDGLSTEILWQTPFHRNFKEAEFGNKPFVWDVENVPEPLYHDAFYKVQQEIRNGNTYLLNLTFPSRINTDLGLEEIFFRSRALYKLYLKDRFVCFSPEIFVRISNGIISSYPMKGTIDATIPGAEQILKNDRKELAEHNTIVDLIRNDLSLVAENVSVEKFRYIDRIKNNRGELLQMSSKIIGKLPADYAGNIGNIIARMLPAGSICGAPKRKTVEIIKTVESYRRGYYTGIFGIFDGASLDSCVLIRFIEKTGDGLIFKSGGGITFLSNCENEYNELIQKIYVPVT
ncbi:MAG: aminodeoxychorismate synthase component I [Prolixibacteraceae bacterium]|nr:aminodeoxychorismate synthase component I [Prolixibacteraceae bacterium]